jgi:uncharacterized protein YgbK (DUF1537 family)
MSTRLISWYGDDFTGSTDALEVLAPHMPAVLFLRQPDDSFFEQFSDYAAFGLAGTSRSQSPEWMDTHLSSSFGWLASLACVISHYKVCSTFDSSPTVGSIGRAMEIGRRVFGARFVPIVAGTPALRRYTAFGHLFAAADGCVYRIDRHPTMKCHPVTPMREADLRLHLREQTDLSVGLLDFVQLQSTGVCEWFRSISRENGAVLIDVVDEATSAAAGRLLWQVDRQPFVVGSSGVEAALIRYWRAEEIIDEPSAPDAPRGADRLLVLSGSCSPVTQRQIEYAGRNGFTLVKLDAREILSGERSSSVAEKACATAAEALSQGRSVVLFTAASAEDRIDSFNSPEERHTLSERAGVILSRVADASRVRRIVVAGGDTSSHGGRQLGIDALTFLAPVAPGAPLCCAWSRTPGRDGLEIVFKGGQMGTDNFFEAVMKGRN